MTKKKIAQKAKRPKLTADARRLRDEMRVKIAGGRREQPLPAGLVERAAERAGVSPGEAPTPPEGCTPAYREPLAARERRAAVEREALTSKVSGAFAEHVRELTTCGLYVVEEDGLTREQAILQWSLATLRAVAIAAEQERPGSLSPSELHFDGSDTAIVLSGVITMLEAGVDVARAIREAELPMAAGGAA
jgi:hypothetical protein